MKKTEKPVSKKHIPLSVQVLTLCLGLVLVISAVLLPLFMRQTNTVAEQNLRLNAETTMRYLEADIRYALGSSVDLTVLAAATVLNVPVQLHPDVFGNMLASVPTAFELYYGTTRSRFDGGYFISASGWNPYETTTDWDQIKRPWFILAMQNSGQITITEPYEDSSTGKICVTIAKTVEDTGKNTVGVMGVDIYLDVLTDIVTSRKITNDGNTVLIDKNGLFVVHEDPAKVLQQNFFDEEQGIAKEAILNPEGSVIIEGNRYWAARPVRGTEWYMVSHGSTAEMLSATARFLRFAGMIILGMLIGVALLAVIFARIITKPFKNLVGIFHVIADGDLTVTSPDYIALEASSLSAAFNNFAVNIKQLVMSIAEKAGKLSRDGGKLAESMTDTASAMNEITANIQSIKTRVDNQSANVTQTNAGMEQITVNIGSLNGNVEQQADSVAQSSAAVEQMLANIQSVTQTLVKNADSVQNLMEASDVGRTGLQKVAADIQEIAKESAGLLEINSVMENISSQTNLLSMNAAIEAAHAGESGKGFAVVAGEIRKLAENSGAQSKTIGTVLKKIKVSIDKITASTDNVLGKFEAIDGGIKTVSDQESNIRSAMEEQGAGSKQILEAIGKLNEITGHVKEGAEKMLQGSDGVIQESKNLEMVTAEIENGMNEMTVGAERVNTAIHQVNDLSGQNRDDLAALVREVSRFKVE